MSTNVKRAALEVVGWLGLAVWLLALSSILIALFNVGHILGTEQRGYDEDRLALVSFGVAVVALLVLCFGFLAFAWVYRRLHIRPAGSLDALFADLQSGGVFEVVEYDGATVLRRKPSAMRRG